MDDAERFLEALKALDTRAHAKLFRRHYRRVLAVLHRVLGSDAELPDVAQDVFLQAMYGIGRFEGNTEQLEPWLLRIAVLNARAIIRRRRTRRRFLVDMSDPPETPGPAVAEAEHMDALRRSYALLDRMPDDERIAIILRDVERMSLPEIAEVCDISLSTAKRRVKRGRVRFERMAKRDPLLCEVAEELKR